MPKQNCWEATKCGRESGGAKEKELGRCPASTEVRLNGVNSGTNGGRSCWGMVGTLCHGEVQGHFAKKIASCLACAVFKQVETEERPNYAGTSKILAILG